MFRGFDTFLGFYHGEINYFNFTNADILDFHDNYNQTYPEQDDYATDIWADESIDILKSKALNNDDTPFTLTIAFNAPHSPFHSRQPWRSQILHHGSFSDDSTKTRKDYVSMIRAMDDRIGDIIDTLKTEMINGVSLWNNSWVYWFSDNGPVITAGNAYPLRGAKALKAVSGLLLMI